MPKLFLFFLLFFAVFGIVFVSVLTHEAFHVIHSGFKAEAICLDLGIKLNSSDNVQGGGILIAHTEFDVKKFNNVEEYHDWRAYSEKIAGILTYSLFVLIGILTGYLLRRYLKP